MRRYAFLALVCLLIGIVGVAVGQDTKAPATAAAPMHIMKAPADLAWVPPPPVFEQNAQMSLLSGDPSKAGLYTVRLKMPAGYKVMPHWHPTDEHVTVISGTFALGMGDKVDEATMTALPAGGYARSRPRCTTTPWRRPSRQVHGMDRSHSRTSIPG
jgi:hypothetical protein